MKKSRILGCAAALSITAVVALPAAGQAQTGSFPSGCGSTNTIDLAPLANVKIKTCELALAPTCTAPVITFPANPLVRADIVICVPVI